MIADPVTLEAYIDGTTARLTAAATILLGQAVYAAVDGIRPASSSSTVQASGVLGLAENSALAGQEVLVTFNGLVRMTTPWPAAVPIYLGADGFPTADSLTGLVSLRLGFVVMPGLFQVRVGAPTVRA